MYLLSSLQPPNSPSLSLYGPFSTYPQTLIEAKQNRLDVLDPLTLLHSIHLNHTVVAMAHIENAIAVLDSSSTLSIVYKSSKVVVCPLATLDTQGHQLVVDSTPFIVVMGRKIVVHGFIGFVQVFTLEGSPEEVCSTSSNGRKRKASSWTSHSVHIGHITVISMAAMDNGLAILYRDHEHEYSMRWYNTNLELVHQFESFAGSPSLVVPTWAGAMVVDQERVYLFGSQEDSMEPVKCSLETSDPSISCNGVVTKTMQKERSVERFQCAAQIDRERTLLVSTTGNTYLLHFKGNRSRSLVVTSFSFISLGSTTIPIPGGLHHLHDNVFYCSSRYSRSVVFAVYSNHPHVGILASIENTTPVVDMEWGDKLYMCQGGYDSGELVRLEERVGIKKTEKVPTRYSVDVVMEKSDKEDPSFVVSGPDGVFYLSKRGTLRDTDTSYNVRELETDTVFDCKAATGPQAATGPLLLTSKGLGNANAEAGRFYGDQAYYVSGNELVEENIKDRSMNILPLPNSSLSGFSVAANHVFITWMDGSYTVIDLSQRPLKPVVGTLPTKGVVYSADVLAGSSDGCVLIYSDSDSNLVQMRFAKRVIGHSVIRTKAPLALRDGIARSPNTVYVLRQDPLGYYRPCILIEAPGVTGVAAQALGGVPKHVGVLQGTQLSIVSPDHESRLHSRQHARYLYTKCVSVGSVVVAVAQETKSDDRGAVARVSRLEVCDSGKVVHSVGDEEEYVDICTVPRPGPPSIVALVCSNGVSSLQLFVLKKRRLQLVHTLSADVPLHSICLVGENPVALSAVGDSLLVAQYSLGDQVSAGWVDHDVSLPTTGIAQAFANGMLYVAHLQGMMEIEIGMDDEGLLVVHKASHSQSLVTTVAAGQIGPHQVVATGDAFGNVRIRGPVAAHFNVGWDQVNCIVIANGAALVGTLNGAVYRVSCVDESTYGFLEETMDELASFCPQYGPRALRTRYPQIGSSQLVHEDAEGVVDLRLIREFVVKGRGVEKERLRSICFETNSGEATVSDTRHK